MRDLRHFFCATIEEEMFEEFHFLRDTDETSHRTSPVVNFLLTSSAYSCINGISMLRSHEVNGRLQVSSQISWYIFTVTEFAIVLSSEEQLWETREGHKLTQFCLIEINPPSPRFVSLPQHAPLNK